MQPIKELTRIEVSQARHTVTVDFDDDEIDLDPVIEALGEGGYSVTRFERLADE